MTRPDTPDFAEPINDLMPTFMNLTNAALIRRTMATLMSFAYQTGVSDGLKEALNVVRQEPATAPKANEVLS